MYEVTKQDGRQGNVKKEYCHFKGHRVTSCQQPQCEGFFEYGLLVYHKEHKEQIKEVGYFTHQESDMTCVTFDIKRSKMFQNVCNGVLKSCFTNNNYIMFIPIAFQ